MTQKELIQEISSDAGITKVQAKLALQILIGTVSQTLKKEGMIRIAGLGSFSAVQLPKRKGRNPRTGEAIKIKASKTVRFKASKILRGVL